jgi:ABC-type antimicrobial peptide transport system ATPase subunit
MEGYPFYIIDVEGNPQDFKFILRSPTGEIVNTLHNSKELAQHVREMVKRLIYSNYGTLSASTTYFEDTNGLIYAFYRFSYPILLEQYLSDLYESQGIRIQYPDMNTYIIILYKLYKVIENPNSPLNPQEFAIIVNPLINKLHWGIDTTELVYLFTEFVRAYYKAIDIKQKARIGYNPNANIMPYNSYPPQNQNQFFG